MKIVINRQLGWELADHLDGYLSNSERTAVFTDLGSGDEKAALHRLIHIVAKKNHVLPARMTEELHNWVRAHNAENIYGRVLRRMKDPFGECP